MCYMFFFFKQKTAYERRISDWSSDVCSSDLQPPTVTQGPGLCRAALPPEPARALAQAVDQTTIGERHAPLGIELGLVPDPQFDRVHPERIGEQIGSASCRERVCQYA